MHSMPTQLNLNWNWVYYTKMTLRTETQLMPSITSDEHLLTTTEYNQ